MFYAGKLKAMPPKLQSDDGKHIIIRPLAYCPEREIQTYANLKKFPIIPCQLCGSQDNLQRAYIKQMLQTWEVEYPGRVDSLFRSLQNVCPSHLADTELFHFAALGQ
jgi:tRNA 2-thiocytidine biosynthesis protein TtcA